VDPTRELVDAGQVGIGLAVVSGAAAVLSVALGIAGKAPTTPRRAGLRRGALLAAGVVLLFPMWLVYNWIEDALGLDSVAALCINLVLFLAVGAASGWAIRKFWPADPPEDASAGTAHGPAS
jgi:hypothetical protein